MRGVLRPLRGNPACLAGLALCLAGCAFDPLAGSAYVPCDPDLGCRAPCTCSPAARVCLPAPGDDRRDCRALEPVALEGPGELPALAWGDPDTTLDLVVTTPADEDDILSDGDLEAMRTEAQAGAGLSLREALRLAGVSALPVRVRFQAGSFGEFLPIVVQNSELPAIDGQAVLLDGRGAGVIVRGGSGLGGQANGLALGGRLVALVDLAVRGFGGAGVWLRGAEDVLLAGLTAEGNTIGVLVEGGSRRVNLGDGSELAGGEGLAGCRLAGGLAGLRVVGSGDGGPVEDLALYASQVANNTDSGVSLTGELRRVSIGPPPGLDARGARGNLIELHAQGNAGGAVRLDGVRGEVLVRGNWFRANLIDVRASACEGDLWVLHNASMHTEVAVLKVSAGGGGAVRPLGLRLFNHASLGPLSEHVSCSLADPGQLALEAGALLTDQPAWSCVCEPACAAWWASAPVVFTGVTPALIASEGWVHLPPGSPGLDGGRAQAVWDGLELDLNGPAPGAFCGAGPDIGAHESCE